MLFVSCKRKNKQEKKRIAQTNCTYRSQENIEGGIGALYLLSDNNSIKRT